MRLPILFALGLLCGLWLAAGEARAAEASAQPVRIASNGWHTAIVLPGPAVRALEAMPEAADFPGAAFLEFGWGDREYYPAGEKTLGLALDAILTPGPAVMHVAPLAAPPERLRPDDEVVTLTLDRVRFARLVQAIADDFERPAGAAAAEPLAPGLYPDSRFYPALGRFSLGNTCNTWTARQLRAAGLPIEPGEVVTASDLMTRLRRALGRVQD